jgi:hypothetical protein
MESTVTIRRETMTLSTIAITIGTALIILGTGYALHRKGRPYNGLLFNVHKLLALAGGVLFITTLVRVDRATGVPITAWIAAAVTGLFVIGLFATGALHSIDAAGDLSNASEGALTAIRLVHKTLPYLAGLGAALTLLLLREHG